ncbi:type VII secretion protein EccB, partial [Streptomyces sp. TRM76130]|nr:type VII secretion protein EccB [Streptomyces sp. TRM76130]
DVGLVTVLSSAVDARSAPPGRALAAACLAVDAVSVPPSGGSLVWALGSSGSDLGDSTYLVTDTGRKYRVPSGTAAEALGYDLTRAQRLPSPLLDMLPTGPDLSLGSARSGREEVTGTSRCDDR